MIPAPINPGLTLCEQVIVDVGTNRVSLINAFNLARVESFPYLLRPLCVFTTLTGGQGEAELSLVITHLETDEDVHSSLHRIAFPDRFMEIRILLRPPDVVLPLPGTYLFTLLIDDDWVAHKRLQVY